MPAARVVAYLAGVPEVGLYILPPFRLDGLATGSLLALVVPRLPDPRRLVPHSVATLSLAALATGLVPSAAGDAFRGTPPMLTLGFTFLAAGFGALVFLAVALPRGSLLPRVLEWKPLRAAGKVSYAMYVFHFPVTVVLRDAGLRPASLAPGALGWAAWLATLLASVSLLAAASWSVLEGPCLSLKDRVEYEFREGLPGSG